MAHSDLEKNLQQRATERTSSPAVLSSIPDWRELNVDEPFYNPVTQQYCIPVATDIDYIDKTIIWNEELIQRVRDRGVQNLWALFNKISSFPASADEVERLQVDIKSKATIGEYYMDSRPCSRLRYLVCVPAADWEHVPHGAPRFLDSNPGGAVAQVVTYTIPRLKKLIASVAKSFEEHGENSPAVGSAGGTRPDIDLFREASRLRAVYPSVLKLLYANGIAERNANEYLIQFNFGPPTPPANPDEDCPPPIFPLINVGLRKINEKILAQRVDVGIYGFKNNPPIKYGRTRMHLANLQKLEAQFDCPDKIGTWGWMDAKTYANITEGISTTVKVWDQFSNSRRGRQIIDDVMGRWPYDEEQVLNTSEDVKKQREAMDTAAKIKQNEENEEKTDWYDNLLLSDEGQKKLNEEIYDTATAFKKLLNNVDLKYFIGIAVRVGLANIPASETFGDFDEFPNNINKMLFEKSMEFLDAEALWGIATECIPSGSLGLSELYDEIGPGSPPRSLEQEAENCPQNMPGPANKILDLVGNDPEAQNCLKSQLEKHCPPEARMFGLKGQVENFMHRHTSNFIVFDRENMCPDPDDTKGAPFTIPTMELPPWRWQFVVDISGATWSAFIKALEDTRDEFVLGIIRQLMRTLYKNIENIMCNWSDMKEFGKDSYKFLSDPALAANTGRFFSDPTFALDATRSAFAEVETVAIDRFKDALVDWGVDPSLLRDDSPNVVNETGSVEYDQRISSFLDEISDCLNPGELRAAMKGKELGQNFQVIERVASEYLPCIDSADAISVLAHASRDADFATMADRTRHSVGEYICDNINAAAAKESFKNSYEGRADADVVDELWQKEIEKTLDQIGNLMALLNTPTDQMFCGIQPPPMPSDPANEHMMGMVVDTAFAGILTNFNQEIASWPLTLLDTPTTAVNAPDPALEEVQKKLFTTPEPGAIRTDDGVYNLPAGPDAPPAPPTMGMTILPGLRNGLQSGSIEIAPNLLDDADLAGSMVTLQLPMLSSYTTGSGVGYENVDTIIYKLWPADPIHPYSYYEEPYTLTLPVRGGGSKYAFSNIPTGSSTGVGTVTLLQASLLPEEKIQKLQMDHPDFFTDSAHPHDLSPEQIMFGNYLTLSVANPFSIEPSLLISDIDGDQQQRLANAFFTQITHNPGPYFDVKNEIAGQIIQLFNKSPLWEPSHRDKKGLMDIKLNRGAPYNHNCPPDSKPKDNLIRTNFEKEVVVETYSQLMAQNPGSPTEPPKNPLNDAMTPALLRTLVRIHVVEVTLRSIFGLANFKGGRSIFNGPTNLSFISQYVKDKLYDFAVSNSEIFLKLGPYQDSIENLTYLFTSIGVDNIDTVISCEADEVYDIMATIMDEEFGGDRVDIVTELARRMKLVPVPESNEFPGAPAPDDPDDPDGPDGHHQLDPFPSLLATRAPRGPLSDAPLSERILLPEGRSFRLGSEFDNLKKGYFVIEKFVEFEPKANPQYDDTFYAYMRNRMVDYEVSQTQIESPKAFQQFFRRAVLRYALRNDPAPQDADNLPWDPDDWPARPGPAWLAPDVGRLEQYFFDKQAQIPLYEDKSPRPDPEGVELDMTARERMRRYLNPDALDDPRGEPLWGSAFHSMDIWLRNRADAVEGATREDLWQRYLPSFFEEKAADSDSDVGWGEPPRDPDTGRRITEFEVTGIYGAVRKKFSNRQEYADWVDEKALEPIREEERRRLDEWKDLEEVYLAEVAEDTEHPDYHVVTRFANRKLNHYFEKLNYGVRLTYVAPHDYVNSQLPAFNSIKGLVGDQEWTKICKIKKAYEINLRTGGLTDAKLVTIPIVEKKRALHLNNLTIANFYGSEGFTGRGQVDRHGTNLDGIFYNAQGGYSGLNFDINNINGLGELRDALAETDDFRMLFDFGLGSTRLTSLIAIYCMQGAELIKPSIKDAFFQTKRAALATLYASQPDAVPEEFFKARNPAVENNGGFAGIQKTKNENASTSGTDGSAAAKTVPFIIKGLAQFQDPSYALASTLDQTGMLPGGLGPTAIAAVAPMNVFLGSVLPPVTPLGIAAYTVGKLPGERRSFEQRTAGAQGSSGEDANNEYCEKIIAEEEE